MDLFNNAWVVGIGGGVLSGLLVTLITRFLFSKRDNREYAQKLAAVNTEVVYALRPGISEGHIPDQEVLSSLINATARKYRVSRDDVFRPKQIAEELIKEIMDSSFISAETKKSYCETLAHLIQVEPAVINISLPEEAERKISESDYRQKLVARMSAILGLTAAMGTMTVTLFKGMGEDSTRFGVSRIFDLAIPSFTVITATMVAMLSMVFVMRIKSLKEDLRRRSPDEKINQ